MNKLTEIKTWNDVLPGFSPYFRLATKGGIIFEVGHCDRTSTVADMYSLTLRPVELTEEWTPIAITHVNADADADSMIVDQVSVSVYADDLDRLIELLQAARDAHQQRVKAAGVTK